MHLNVQKQSAGFALIAAVFLIVVVSLVIVYLQRLSASQNQVNIVAAQSARAQQAAQSGLEWGAYRLSQQSLSCANSSVFTLNAIATGMQVTVECAMRTYVGGIDLYTLTSTAEQGALGNPDYVFKRLRASAEIGS
jgi:MSHA biogenesis protein MshP